jgi:hypothetical protein
MDSFQLVIWDDHEKGEKGLPDCKQVVVGWFPFEGGEGVVSFFEEGGDCIRVILVDCRGELLANKESIFLARGAG